MGRAAESQKWTLLTTTRAPAATVEGPAGQPPASAMSQRNEAPQVPGPDPESRAWLLGLRADGPRGEEASRRLHDLLLRAARFEINRRRGSHPHLRGGDLDDLAHQAANDALLAILGKLDNYRGESRFTTWAYKFALLEAAVKLRRRAWQGREVPLEPEHWSTIAEGGSSPAGEAEGRELLDSIGTAIETELSSHQREVLVAVALNDVPIDVLAERLNTTRGALYKTIHDARKKLRSHLADAGLRFEAEPETMEQRS
jgi:RNA polymerase sigma-70 factor, ECF subfamily